MIVSADIIAHNGTFPGIVEPIGSGIAITPCVTRDGSLTGEFTAVHLHGGRAHWVTPEAGCATCARKAARLALDSGVDWDRPPDQVKGDPGAKKTAHLMWLLLARCESGRDCDDLPEPVGGFEAVLLP